MFRFILKVGLLWFFLLTLFQGGTALANHQVDQIEAGLSDAVGELAKAKLQDALSDRDQAYAYFLVAVYNHDPTARQKAEALYTRLDTPEGEAFLGSLMMLKARDWEGGVLQVFKRKRLVQQGIEQLDQMARAHPEDPQVHIIRAISYLGLPAFFGRFNDGLADMEQVIRWMDGGKIKVPQEELLFRDRSSLYYYAGRYYLKQGEREKAKEMFSKANASNFHTPFAAAARKRIAALS
ncbi:MAG: hypothetical protein HY282_12760 [Nitrospirae bacterium]|nr:hypothetical protein [Candidatus Manganitrophaceae bacterium]